VTAEQAAAVAKAHFDPATASLVVVGDAKVFGAKLKAKFPQLEMIAIDKLNLDSPTLRSK
jgi:zinc protease